MTLFGFLLKASLGIILFYLVYWFFLRNETFYKANRWYLLFSLIFSVLLPLIPFKYEVFYHPENISEAFNSLTSNLKGVEIANTSENSAVNFDWLYLLAIFYIVGAVLFLLRLVFHTASLFYFVVKSEIKKTRGTRILENEKYEMPFSFFNIIFINSKFHTQENLPEILAHESVHIRENHWFDLLFIELLTVIFWFNPFIWFFERSIKQNHEYLADKGVISMGHSVARYQALLLNQLMGMQIIGVTNNLNFALNTNRLKMMTKKKTPKIKGYKFMFALPTLAILLTAFAEPKYVSVNNNERNIPQSSIQDEKQLVIHGKVVEEKTGKPLPGTQIMLKGTNLGTVTDIDGLFTIVDPNPSVDKHDGSVYSRILVSFVGFKTIENTISASGAALKDNLYTFKMEKEVIGALHKYTTEELPVPDFDKNQTNRTEEKSTSQKDRFEIVEDMPQYPGGPEGLGWDINQLQKELLKTKKIVGKAKIGFSVSTSGKVTNVKVLEADNPLVAESASYIMKNIKDWKPGAQRMKKVSVDYNIVIEF